MTPVFQTRFGTDKDAPPSTQGNCFCAAFASLMDLTLEEAPEYDDESYEPGTGNWFDPWADWCDANGWEWAWLTWGDNLSGHIAPQGLSLASGPSPRGNWKHVVVAEDGLAVHDPAGVDVGEVPYFDSYVVFRREWDRFDDGRVKVPMVSLPGSRWIPAGTPPLAVVDEAAS